MAAVGYEQDPIVDAFILCGHRLDQFQPGFKWEPDVVIEQINAMEDLIPCGVCNMVIEDGWVEHAITTHCEGKHIRSDQLKLYRLSKGPECLMCNLVYASDEERNVHINHHLLDKLSLSKKFPLTMENGTLELTSHQQAIKLKSYLHFNFYKKHNISLYLLIPSWIRGESVKEKLRNIDKPTYIPVALSTNATHLCEYGIKTRHYNIHKGLLYTPTLDETFSGIRDYRRMYGKLLIRLVASLQQQPDSMKNIKFLLCKSERGSLLFRKYLVHVTNDDINEVLQDVIENRRSVVCQHDLFDEEGCVDEQCSCFVHFGINLSLEKGAEEPREEYIMSTRHYSLNNELGKFEFMKNPEPNAWIEFAAEIISRKQYQIAHPTPAFTYVVLCTRIVETDELPNLTNINRFSRTMYYHVYVGLSNHYGIPPHHFNDLTNENEEEEDPDIINYEVNEDGERVFTGMTELAKEMKRGSRALYMLRLQMMENYQRAEMLEAAYQLYGLLTKEFQGEQPVQFINKRLELSSLSFLTIPELQGLIELNNDDVRLFYDSAETFSPNLIDRDWSIIERPILFNEMHKLPL